MNHGPAHDHDAAAKRSPWIFFALVMALSLPFWIAGAMSRAGLMPGLPVAALMALCPGLAAIILTYLERRPGAENRFSGVRALLKRAIDFDRIKQRLWYLPILLLMPLILLLSYGAMRASGIAVPDAELSLFSAIGLFLIFLIPAFAEELGWSAYILDAMQVRRSALSAALVLGTMWAIWHLVPLMQGNRSASWIAGWCLFTVAQRVLIVWLYNNTGRSAFSAILFHAIVNVSWQMFPNHGSHFDPRFVGAITALAAVAVCALWGPRTLSRWRGA